MTNEVTIIPPPEKLTMNEWWNYIGNILVKDDIFIPKSLRGKVQIEISTEGMIIKPNICV